MACLIIFLKNGDYDVSDTDNVGINFELDANKDITRIFLARTESDMNNAIQTWGNPNLITVAK